jgi:hypothetical protein
MQAFVHHTPHHTQVINLYKNTMAGTKLVAVGFIVLLRMGLANTAHQIYASKFLNQAFKYANSNTGQGVGAAHLRDREGFRAGGGQGRWGHWGEGGNVRPGRSHGRGGQGRRRIGSEMPGRGGSRSGGGRAAVARWLGGDTGITRACRRPGGDDGGWVAERGRSPASDQWRDLAWGGAKFFLVSV